MRDVSRFEDARNTRIYYAVKILWAKDDSREGYAHVSRRLPKEQQDNRDDQESPVEEEDARFASRDLDAPKRRTKQKEEDKRQIKVREQ